jgi:hypothetical protein
MISWGATNAIGRNEITPAVDREFRRDEELIVVFLVYNPMVTAERQFDVRVEYHFYRKAEDVGPGPAAVVPGAHPPVRAGEQYFNSTDPQRFNPALMGAAFNRVGEPIMAGQVVPCRVRGASIVSTCRSSTAVGKSRFEGRAVHGRVKH